MRLFLFSLVLAMTLSFGSIVSATGANAGASAADDVQVIEVTAKKYEFDPSPIRVKQGAHVQLKITATDHAHGFAVRVTPEGVDAKADPGLVFSSPLSCQKIEKGQTVTVEFVAKTPGTYQIRCCTHCGIDHRSMKGQLIVEP